MSEFSEPARFLQTDSGVLERSSMSSGMFGYPELSAPRKSYTELLCLVELILVCEKRACLIVGFRCR